MKKFISIIALFLAFGLMTGHAEESKKHDKDSIQISRTAEKPDSVYMRVEALNDSLNTLNQTIRTEQLKTDSFMNEGRFY